MNENGHFLKKVNFLLKDTVSWKKKVLIVYKCTLRYYIERLCFIL